MLTRIEVGQTSPATDSQARKIQAAIHENFHFSVEKVAVHSVYILEMDLREAEKEKIGSQLLADPITETYRINTPLATDFDFSGAVRVHIQPRIRPGGVICSTRRYSRRARAGNRAVARTRCAARGNYG